MRLTEQLLDYSKAAKEPFRHMLAIERYFAESDLRHKLRELVKIRAPQIIGYGYCLDVHTEDAVALGEWLERLFVCQCLAGHVVFYRSGTVHPGINRGSDTHLARRVAYDLYQRVREHFDEKQTVDLS